MDYLLSPATSPSSNPHHQSHENPDIEPDFDEELALDTVQVAMENRFRDFPNRISQMQIEPSPDANDEDKEAALTAGVSMVIDLTGDDTQREQHFPTISLPAYLVPPREALGEYMYCGELLRDGVTIEIPAILDLYQASFLYIKSIIHEPNRGIFVKGLPLTRTRNLRGKLPRLRNELCLMLQVNTNDDRSDEEQALIELEVTKVMTTRTLYFTNADFPARRYPRGVHQTIGEIEQKGILICRWRCRLAYRHEQVTGKKPPPVEFTFEHLSKKDASSASYRVSDVQRRNVWRGGKTRGGAFSPHQSPNMEFTVDIETETDMAIQSDSEHQWTPGHPEQQYTFADMFCGAGGASCGVEMAGFFIKLSCDKSRDACETYRHRFPSADLREMDIFEFIKEGVDPSPRVDAMHISPPCQFWSPAHTVPGVNDDANIASLYSCHQLLNKVRPRVFTLEQTFGILHPRFEHYFNALIHSFTQYSYSVRWKLVDLLIWGCPARRKRLIMIGSCPGEKLPPFPPPTHSEHPVPGDGTRPYVTVRQVLRKITPTTTLQYPRQLCVRPPWDPNIPLQRTITTHGGIGNYHPSGKRYFTLREYATLQGFPVDYEFCSSNIKRQIGNAFPPCVVKTLYKHIKRCLWDADRIIKSDDDESEEAETSGANVMLLEEDEEDEEDEEEENDDEVIYMGHRGIASATRSSRHPEWQQEMELDVEDQSSSALPLCVDANQQRRRVHIDLTPIDLTRDSAC